MKITDALAEEHRLFGAQFDRLERAVPTAATIAEVQARAALIALSLKDHAQLEDELLVAALQPHLSPDDPLAAMRWEHDEIHRSLAGLLQVQSLAEAQRVLLQTVALTRQHFAKEDAILFPLAEQVLDAETLDRLGAQWARRRDTSANEAAPQTDEP